MIEVSSYNEILILIEGIRKRKKDYYTNFFIDQEKFFFLKNQNVLSVQTFNNTLIFIKKNLGFENIYFCTCDLDELSFVLSNIHNSDPNRLLITDIVGREPEIRYLVELVKNTGFFHQYTILNRMNRLEYKREPSLIKEVLLPSNDEEEIYTLLYKFFDPYAEQLPFKDEIIKWITDGHILVYRKDKGIIGFLIYDLIGLTSYLRYWFVHPDFQNQGVGSALLRSYFYKSNDAKRQLFWVIKSNDNAIKRYVHYGFKFENLLDYVLINKNIKYERENNYNSK